MPCPVTLPDSPRGPEPALVPHPVELAALFQQFVRYWSGSECKYRPGNSSRHLEKPAELYVHWAGSIRGILLLRVPRVFLEELGDCWSLQKLNFPSLEELFREMGVLFSVYLMHSLWVDEFFEMGPIITRPSRMPEGPDGGPRVACALEVDRQPVEIGLWMEASRKVGP